MISRVNRLWLATLLAAVLLTSGVSSKRAQFLVKEHNGEKVVEWYCPPEHVLFLYEKSYWCFEKCAECPNGFCHENECNCFPGSTRNRQGVCEPICKNCENGWCSSVSKCECQEGFTLHRGRCVPQIHHQSNVFEQPGYPAMGLSPETALELSSHLATPLVEAPYLHVQVSSRPVLRSRSSSVNVMFDHFDGRVHYHSHIAPRHFRHHGPPPDRRWAHPPPPPCHDPHFPPNFSQFIPQNPLSGPPQAFPQYIPQLPPQGAPQYPLHPFLQPVPQYPSQLPPQGAPQYSPQLPPQGEPQYPPQGAPQYPPQLPSQGAPQYPPQHPPQGEPQYPPQGAPQYPPQHSPQGAPQYPSQPPSQGAAQIPFHPHLQPSPQYPPQHPPQGAPQYPSQQPPQGAPQYPSQPHPQEDFLPNPIPRQPSGPKTSQETPDGPLESPSQSPSQWNPQTSRPPHQPDPRPEQNPDPSPDLPSSASRPDSPSSFDKVDPQSSSGGDPQPPSCETDFIWDPKAEACVAYESLDPPKMNHRMSYYETSD